MGLKWEHPCKIEKGELTGIMADSVKVEYDKTERIGGGEKISCSKVVD